MAKQQTKRRRKRYQAGSAYAGHVRPSGILGFLGSRAMIQIIFVGMALALVAGGGFAIFSGSLFSSNATQDDFVVPPSETVLPTTVPGDLDAVRQYTSPPTMIIDTSKTYVATIKTATGDIQVELAASEAPETVNNFVFLAEDGFYDGLTFYQVTQGFAAQAGDPTCVAGSAGCRGDAGPGYELEESPPGAVDRGSIGMANGSQFFIALAQSQQFEGFHAFGTVISGLDIAEQLTAGTEIESIEIQAQ